MRERECRGCVCEWVRRYETGGSRKTEDTISGEKLQLSNESMFGIEVSVS